MNLSTAIREGAKLRPQAFGTFFVFGRSGRIRSCVIGAVAETIDPNIAENWRFEEVVPWLISDNYPTSRERGKIAVCPECGLDVSTSTIYRVMEHLNDRHRWTREAIADLLEGLGL